MFQEAGLVQTLVNSGKEGNLSLFRLTEGFNVNSESVTEGTHCVNLIWSVAAFILLTSSVSATE